MRKSYIPKNSFIIMDNASYHNVLVDDAFPTSSILKQELRDWLTAHHYDWTSDMLKAEQYALSKDEHFTMIMNNKYTDMSNNR
jgi:hypothetical protein